MVLYVFVSMNCNLLLRGRNSNVFYLLLENSAYLSNKRNSNGRCTHFNKRRYQAYATYPKGSVGEIASYHHKKIPHDMITQIQPPLTLNSKEVHLLMLKTIP